jgi:presenilin-like A22 family membrane protease
MKHTLLVTLVLVSIFLISQIVGLLVIERYVEEKTIDRETGQIINTTYTELPFGMQRPQIEESKSYIFIIGAVLLGTVIILVLVKFRSFKIWKLWFLMSVVLCLTVSFSAFMLRYQIIAAGIAIVLALIKIYKPNVIIHNITEIFIYGGLAAIFVPVINLYAIVILLLIISVYDMIAVWKSKHMIKMAMFQAESKVFAGFSIPYKKGISGRKNNKTREKERVTKDRENIQSAILGGGDIGFPLLFAGVVMKSQGFLKVLIIPLVASAGLFLLLYFAKKERFYPAMPFLTLACFVGYGIVMLL